MRPVQLIKNGNFSLGILNWKDLRAAEFSIEDGAIKIRKKSSDTGTGAIVYSSSFVGDTTHSYYIRLSSYSSNSTIYCGFSNNSVVSDNLQITNSDFEWKTLDAVTCPIRSTDVFTLRVGNSSSGIGVIGYFKDVICIDLTETFGAGNEPTIETCRTLFPDNYYNYNTNNNISKIPANELLLKRRIMMQL